MTLTGLFLITYQSSINLCAIYLFHNHLKKKVYIEWFKILYFNKLDMLIKDNTH